MIQAIIGLLSALPEILRLIRDLQEAKAKEESDAKLKDDIQKIRQAFKERDEKALNDAFNS